MRRRSLLQDKDQLVTGSIECPHSAVVLHPDDQVFELFVRPRGDIHAVAYKVAVRLLDYVARSQASLRAFEMKSGSRACDQGRPLWTI